MIDRNESAYAIQNPEHNHIQLIATLQRLEKPEHTIDKALNYPLFETNVSVLFDFRENQSLALFLNQATISLAHYQEYLQT